MVKRVFSILLAAVFILVMVSACASSPAKPATTEGNVEQTKEAQPSDSKDSGETETVTFISTNDPNYVYIKDVVAAFQKENPSIKINLIEVPFDQFDSKIQTMLASKTPLDTATHFGWTGFGSRLANDQLMDLAPLLEKYSFDPAAEGIPQSMMDIWKANGKVYGIPINAYPSIMLYNKDMFDEAGLPYPPANYDDPNWTWDKMVEYAQKLTKNSDDPVNAQYGLTWNWDSGGREQLPQYFGHTTFDEATFTKNMGLASESYFDKPEVVADYQKVLDLIFKFKVNPTVAMTEAMGGNAFFAGKVAMTVEGAWIMAPTNDATFKVGIAAIPKGGGVRDVLWINPFWIFKDSKAADATFKLLMYMAKTDAQKLMSKGMPPANLNALEAFASNYKNLNPKDIISVYEGVFKDGFEGMSHLMPDAGALNTLLTNEMGAMFNEGKPASEVLPTVQEKVKQYIADTKSKYGR